MHQIEFLEREKWNRKEFLEDNSEDESGFCVTHRTDELIGWKPPCPRAEGYKNLLRENESDFKDLGYVPEDHEYWWKGQVSLLGASTTYNVRLLEDTDRGFLNLCPTFTLEGTMRVCQSEVIVPWTP